MLSHFARLAELIGHARARNLLVACGFAIGLVLASAAAWFLAESRANDVTDAEREMKNLSLILAEEMDRRLQGLDLVQIGLIEHMQQLGIDSPESFKRQMTSFAVHQDLAHRIADLPHVGALSLHDADGKLVNFSRSWPAPNIDVGDRDFIKLLLAPNAQKTVIGEPSKSVTTGRWTIYFSRRFEAPDGRLIGIVLSTIFTDYFERLFSQISLSDGSAFTLFRVTGAKPRAAGTSGGLSAAADEIWKLRDGRTAADAEPGAKIIPKSDAKLPAGLGEPEKCIAAVATDVAVGSAADVAFGHLATDVVFRAIGVQRSFRVIEHHQQFVFVGVQPLHQRAVSAG